MSNLTSKSLQDINWSFKFTVKILKEKASLLENENKKVYNKLFDELTEVNTKLWDIEDNIRKFELKKDFNDEFIELARSVYFLNDERFKVKSKINELFNSKIQEVKEYIKYR